MPRRRIAIAHMPIRNCATAPESGGHRSRGVASGRAETRRLLLSYVPCQASLSEIDLSATSCIAAVTAVGYGSIVTGTVTYTVGYSASTRGSYSTQ